MGLKQFCDGCGKDGAFLAPLQTGPQSGIAVCPACFKAWMNAGKGEDFLLSVKRNARLVVEPTR